MTKGLELKSVTLHGTVVIDTGGPFVEVELEPDQAIPGELNVVTVPRVSCCVGQQPGSNDA